MVSSPWRQRRHDAPPPRAPAGVVEGVRVLGSVIPIMVLEIREASGDTIKRDA